VAVLAALNVADELFKLEERHRSGEERVETTARELLAALEESLREPTQTSPALP
jgi:cell division protein ZapA (FtsZ GTPase activity inhibitor)